MNRKRSYRGVIPLAVLGLAATLAGAPAVAAEQNDRPATQLSWGECPEGVENPAQGSPQLQCTTVPVPLDYADPDGKQIELTISRLASTKPDKRRGVLLLNPGGPGGTGLDQATLLTSEGIPSSVLDSYDLIGMDTRGVGHSAPVSCGFTNDQEYYGAIPPYAADDKAVTEWAKNSKTIADQCAAHDKDGRLRHLTTANYARDLDRVRAALGEEKASFLGYSYGTALGAAYASMFPERADRIVLDSNIGDTHLDRDGLRRYAMGMEETFPDFAEWAAERNDSYGLGSTPQEVRENYLATAERLDKNPVNGLNGRTFRLSVFGSLYAERSYGRLAQSWQSLLHPGKAAPAGGAAGAKSALSPNDNTWSVFLAVTCNDIDWSENVDDYRRAVAEDREKYRLFGAATANISPCAFWKHEPAEPPVEIDDEGPANVLIAQNRHDAVTPLRGGQLLDEKFGERSRLLTVDGSGHGAYVLGKNACALNTVTDYLVDGTMPEQDTTCH